MAAEARLLWTEEGEKLISASPKPVPWNVYPRPQLRRAEWLNLNGEWEYCAAKGPDDPDFSGSVLVPFCPESLLSGVHAPFAEHVTHCYRRTFSVPESFTSRASVWEVSSP